MASNAIIVLSLLLVIGFVEHSVGEILFSKLPETITVTGSPVEGQTLQAGVDSISVQWSLNPNSADITAYSKIKLLLCYAPESQKERGWRKTVDNLSKDKTCQFKIAAQPYSTNGTAQYTIEKSIPTAIYFIRAYALDSSDNQLAYGQTTNAAKTTNLFNIQGITGRTTSIDITAGVFSAFAVVTLVYFFVVEKRKKQ